MSDRLVDLSISSFVGRLAAKEPVPGGGGTAAVVGALASALCSMVGAFTLGKRAYASVEDDVSRMLGDAEALRRRLLELVDEDAAAFEPLSRAYGIARDDPSRAEVLEAATKGACAAPLEMLRQVARVVELLEEMGEKGSRMLVSDVACGASLARAALEAASVNVFVNTKALSDRAFAEAAEAECDELLAAFVPRAEAVLASAVARLRS